MHARVHRLVIQALDDAPGDHIIWMPARTTAERVGVRKLGNGAPSPRCTITTNTRSDLLAIAAVLEHTDQAHARSKLNAVVEAVMRRAYCICTAVHECNRYPIGPKPESTVSSGAVGERWQASERAMRAVGADDTDGRTWTLNREVWM